MIKNYEFGIGMRSGSDVIVHHFTAVDALTGSTLGDRWSVWLEDESHGSFDNEAEAVHAARALAAETGRSAWLNQEGNPPIQIAAEDSWNLE
jgi:hypothetical protein